MGARDFYKLDLRRNRELAGFNGALGGIDKNSQRIRSRIYSGFTSSSVRLSRYKIVFMIALEI